MRNAPLELTLPSAASAWSMRWSAAVPVHVPLHNCLGLLRKAWLSTELAGEAYSATSTAMNTKPNR